MRYSEVLECVLKRAEEVKQENSTTYLSAPCIFVAFAELCESEYRGITPYSNQYLPEWGEEERVRYAFRKMMKFSPLFTGGFVEKRIKKEFAKFDQDFIANWKQNFQLLMLHREKEQLSADIVFLAVLLEMAPQARFGLQSEYENGFDMTAIMADIDSNFYDYMIEQIGNIQAELQKKVDEAIKRRDWKPARKFAQPEEVLQRLYEAVEVTKNERSMELRFPYFFEGKRELMLTFIKKDGYYHVHDNGCTTGNERVKGEFSQACHFLKYLQKLILRANEDMIGCQVEMESVEVDWSQGDALDGEALLDELKKCVNVSYDEKKGLIIGLDMRYSINETCVSYQIETLDDGRLRFSDEKKGKILGEILESFYWNHDDISFYTDFLQPYYDRFGGECIGKDIYMTAEITDGNYVPALFRFLNLAVLLSEFGGLIDVPERKE